MPDHVVLLSVPALRREDVASMPNLKRLAAGGDDISLVPSFPCVTCPVQVNMTTGRTPREHGVVANSFYWRDKRQVEMWTAWNKTIEAPQIWDTLREQGSGATSAVWFPLLAKGAGADLVCTPAPIHNPDGSESLWCYTQPTEMYGELRDALSADALLGAAGEYQIDRLDLSLRGARRRQASTELLLYLSAASGLCRAKVGPR
jgi:hypothetical protein